MEKFKNKIIKVPRFEKKLGFQTTEKRSILMSKIKSSETEPERILRKKLWKAGIRYRINVKELPGNPDIVIKNKKIIVFVDGEFWHGYNWATKKKKIKSNRKFWIPKIERNIQRDMENNLKLKNLGFKVLRFWGHEIKNNISSCIKRILKHTNKKFNK